MKTMTFSGRTMREAIALAKARFGAEVDILDSGAVGDEVQVTVVVPIARSARRRQALAQVSASINALAARTASAQQQKQRHWHRWGVLPNCGQPGGLQRTHGRIRQPPCRQPGTMQA